MAPKHCVLNLYASDLTPCPIVSVGIEYGGFIITLLIIILLIMFLAILKITLMVVMHQIVKSMQHIYIYIYIYICIPAYNDQHTNAFETVDILRGWGESMISLCVPNNPINNIPALGQIMAWCRSGDRPLSEPMMIKLLTHLCFTLNKLTCSCQSIYLLLQVFRRTLDTPCHMRALVLQFQFCRLWAVSVYKCLASIGIPMIKIKRSWEIGLLRY